MTLQGGSHINVDLPETSTQPSHSHQWGHMREEHPHFGLISQGMAPKDTQEQQSNGVGDRDKFWEAVVLAYTSVHCADRKCQLRTRQEDCMACKRRLAPSPVPYTECCDAVLIFAQLGQVGGLCLRLPFPAWFGVNWPQAFLGLISGKPRAAHNSGRQMEKILTFLGSVSGSTRGPPAIHCSSVVATQKQMLP